MLIFRSATPILLLRFCDAAPSAYLGYHQLRGMDPEFLSKYFRAKRKYVPARMDHRYNMDDTVAVISIALGKDMFPWFNEHGMPVDREKTPFSRHIPSGK